MSLRSALILAINTSILIVVFAFSAWLYVRARGEAEARVEEAMDKAAAMTAALADLRERELGSVAVSLAARPMLRGAAATGDRETVVDVLSAVAAKNRLDSAALLRGAKVLYSHPATAPSASQGTFEGEAPLGGDGDLTLRVSQAITTGLLDAWSAIAGVRYAQRRAGAGAVHNLPSADAGLALASLPRSGVAILASGEARYYGREADALGGRLNLALYSPYAPFWTGFERTRNSLAVLGATLFFLGLLLSVGFSGVVERWAPRPPGAGVDLERVLDAIERARARLLEKA